MKVSQPQFGARLRIRRTQLGLSQKDLAGGVVTPSYISLLERGDRVPTLDVVVQLAKMLDTTVADVLGTDVPQLLTASEYAGHDHLLSQLQARGFAESGDLVQARRTLESTLRSLQGRGGDEQLLELGIELSSVLLAAGEHDERLRLVDQLLALDLAIATAELKIPLTIDRASTLRELGRLTEARDTSRSVLAMIGDTTLAGAQEHVRALGVLCSVLCELEEFDAAAGTVGQMLEVAAKLGLSGVLGRANWLAAMAYARMSRLDLAAEHLQSARRLLPLGAMSTLEWLRLCRSTAAILLQVKDFEASREWLEAAEVTARMTGLAKEQAAVSVERARYESAAGNQQHAAELYRQITGPGTPLTGLDLVTALQGQGNALQQLGRTEEAIEVLRRTASLFEQSGNFRQAAEAWRRVDELRQPPAAADRGQGKRKPGGAPRK